MAVSFVEHRLPPEALGGLLRAVHLDAASFRVHTLPSSAVDDAPPRSPTGATPRNVLGYYYLVEGELEVNSEGRRLVVRAGDIVLLRHSGSWSGPRAFSPVDPDQPSRLMCGRLECDRVSAQGLFHLLPPVVVVNTGSVDSGSWLRESLHFLMHLDAHDPAHHGAVLSRLAEVLLMETLRSYLQEPSQAPAPDHPPVDDPYVFKALMALLGDPRRPWTLDSLGREIGLSRTRLAQRFSDRLGMGAMAYLCQRRLHLGAELLLKTDWDIAHIAREVGFVSESGFSRSFQREFSLAPGRYRRCQQGATTEAADLE